MLVVAFAALLPIAVLRVLRPEPNHLRPFILIQTRLVAFVIRAVRTKGKYSKSLFLAEQVRHQTPPPGFNQLTL